MTRINVGIRAKELCREHLLAEHREIKRTPNKVGKGKFILKGMPKQFCLGTGHEKFFYNKLGYLKNRYEELYKECCDRGYIVEYYGRAWDDIPASLLGIYTPTKQDRALLVERINERLDTMSENYCKKEKYYDCLRLGRYKLYT